MEELKQIIERVPLEIVVPFGIEGVLVVLLAVSLVLLLAVSITIEVEKKK